MKTQTIFFILYFFIITQINGQVTIGSGRVPQEYEILKIDGNGRSGLRLSRLSNTERDALQEKMRIAVGSSIYKASAKGLTIYNTTTNTIEFWNGAKWLTLGSSIQFVNGLTDQQLGGTLIKNTSIDVNNKKFSLNINNGGEFSINGENLKMTTSDFQIGKDTDRMKFLVKDDDNEVLSVNTSNEVAISASKTKAINVNNGALTISDTRVTIPTGATLQYKDGKESDEANLSNLILTSDADGNANWKKLEATTKTQKITILPRTNGKTFTINTWNTLTEQIKLEKGIWMIMGRYMTYSSYRSDQTTANNSNYLTLLRINGDPSNSPSNRGSIFVTAALPEKKSTAGNEGAGPYASPNMVAYLEIDTDNEQTFTIDLYTGKPNTWKPYNSSSWLGEPYFLAIKIQ